MMRHHFLCVLWLSGKKKTKLKIAHIIEDSGNVLIVENIWDILCRGYHFVNVVIKRCINKQFIVMSVVLDGIVNIKQVLNYGRNRDQSDGDIRLRRLDRDGTSSRRKHTSGSPETVRWLATRKSQHKASISPPPRQNPCSLAIVGFSNASNSSRHPCRPSRNSRLACSGLSSLSRIVLTSRPMEKLFPWPWTITAQTSFLPRR